MIVQEQSDHACKLFMAYLYRMPDKVKPKESINDLDFQYKNKFKSAVYVFLLFILLSNKTAYKILDIIIKVFSSNIDIIDDCESPLFVGIFIMAFIMALIIFVF